MNQENTTVADPIQNPPSGDKPACVWSPTGLCEFPNVAARTISCGTRCVIEMTTQGNTVVPSSGDPQGAIFNALWDVWQHPKELPTDFATEGTDAVLAAVVVGDRTVADCIAIARAVMGEDFEGDGSYPHTDAFLERLRAVKA
jgi:hypothetical protein